MPRYDQVWANLAERAVLQGGINADSFVRQLVDAGVSEQRILEMVEQDLLTEGPVFGSFIRSITGASGATVGAATAQGEVVGRVQVDASLRSLADLADIDDVIDAAIDGADPELAQTLEDAVAVHMEEMWVAALVKTCHLCLPLHGTIRTRAEWQELGLSPGTIHPASWGSLCYCRLVPAGDADRTEEIEPLRRVKTKSATGKKVSRRTARAITQVDLDKATEARNEAMTSLQGRRTLRLLGESNKET